MQYVKPTGDGVSLGLIVGAMGGWLPTVAALLAVIWWLIRIYETKTVQKWVNRPHRRVCNHCGNPHE
jgi:hypothetical protein